jgi:hypothetical protein
MGSDRHHHDASVPGDERLRQALHRLADSAGGTPALSGAELRALAGRRRRRTRLAVVPAAAAAGLLAGITAFALAGGPATHHGHTAPARTAVPVAPSPPRESAPTPSGTSRAPGLATTAPPPGVPAETAPPRAPRPVPPGPPRASACAVPREGETLVLLHALSAPLTLTAGTNATDALLSAVPVSCTRGHLAPSGPLQQLETAPDAVVTTTAPLGNGPASTPSTLEELVVKLAGHPDQLFGIRRDASGRVIRLDEVYAR